MPRNICTFPRNIIVYIPFILRSIPEKHTFMFLVIAYEEEKGCNNEKQAQQKIHVSHVAARRPGRDPGSRNGVEKESPPDC